MLTKSLSLVCVVFALFIAGCHDSHTADVVGPPLGQFERIDLEEGSDSGFWGVPNIGFDDEGNTFVVMLKNWEIRANRYEAGSGWGIPERLDTGLPLSNAPVIAVAGNGNALAAWTQTVASATSYCYTSYYDRDLGWGEPVRLDSGTGPFVSRAIRIAVDADENYLLVWEQLTPGDYPTFGAILSKRFSPLSGWQDEVIISKGTGLTSSPTVKLNSSGHGFAIWSQAVILNRAGYDPLTGWEPAVEFDTNNGGTLAVESGRGISEFVVDEDGDAISAWVQDRDKSVFTYENDIFTSQCTSANGWGAPEVLQIDSPGDGHGLRIGISGDGTTVLTWTEKGDFPQSWYRIYNKATGWTARQRISALGGAYYITDLSVNDQGNAVALWLSYVRGKTRIFISRYTMHGNWTASKEIDAGELQVPIDVKMVLDNQNMITVTFESYAARLSFYD